MRVAVPSIHKCQQKPDQRRLGHTMSALQAVIGVITAPVWLTTPIVMAQASGVLNTVDLVQAPNPYQLAPSALVHLAHQGGLRAYGIPGFTLFTSAYALGQIDAAKLVAAAIKAQLLPASAAADASYLKAVSAQLDVQEGID